MEVSISICSLFVKFCDEGVRSADADNCVEEIDFFIWVLAFEFDGCMHRVEFGKEVV